MSGNHYVVDTGSVTTDNTVVVPPEPAPAPPVPVPTPTPAPPVPTPQPSNSLDAEKVKKTIELILKVANTATKLIPGDIDDRIVEVLKQVATQEWLPELIVLLLGMSPLARSQVLASMGPPTVASCRPPV